MTKYIGLGLLVFFFIPFSMADLILRTPSGSFYLSPWVSDIPRHLNVSTLGTSYAFQIFRCAASVPGELIEKDPSRFCPESVAISSHADLAELEDLDFSFEEDKQLVREMERAGLNFQRPLIGQIVEGVFSEFGSLDVREFPVLASALIRTLKIEETTQTQKEGVFRVNFAQKRTRVRLSHDGSAVFYAVGNTILGFDLWSEILLHKVELPNVEYSDPCFRTKYYTRYVLDHFLTKDGRYLIALGRSKNAQPQDLNKTYLFVYDLITETMAQRFRLGHKDEATRILGLSLEGGLALRADEGAPIHFVSFNGLLNGEFTRVEAPRAFEEAPRELDPALKKAIFKNSKEEDLAKERVAEIRHGLGSWMEKSPLMISRPFYDGGGLTTRS